MNTQHAVRTLWQRAYPEMNNDELDVYFDEIFAPQAMVTAESAGQLCACAQWEEHRMSFVGQTVSVGVVSALLASPDLKAPERSAKAAQVLREIHQRQYAKGMMLSLVIPADAKQRQWLERQGYMTTTHQLTAETKIPQDFVADDRVEVTEAEEWGRELWIYYTQHAGLHDFELKLTENHFFAMIARHDLRGGSVLVARRHGKIVGLALAQREGKPLKNGKTSGKQFRMNLKYVLASDPSVLHTLQQKAIALAPDCRELVMTGGCPAKGFRGARPYAMMRVIDAERFLQLVAQRLPGLQLTVGIDSDCDLPVNNRGYRLRDGRLYVTPQLPDSIVTPGGIPAMLFSGQPVLMPEL